MDRLVDHLLVLEGDGVVRDFPGNYSQYRTAQRDSPEPVGTEIMPAKEPAAAVPSATATPPAKKRTLSYKEKRELEELDKQIAQLTQEKKEVTEKLNGGSTPFDELQRLSLRIGEIDQLLDEKEMRWLELSEAEG
jgi:ATP-binding cassette subfamily F protein uup